MWNYCIYLGSDSKYDYGVYISTTGEVSHAIVYDNEPGSYLSGELDYFYGTPVTDENINRWITFQLNGL